MLDKNSLSLSIDKGNTENVINEINDYEFVFDVPPALQIQDEVEKNIKNDEKPNILPDFSLPSLLTTKEIEREATKKMKNL